MCTFNILTEDDIKKILHLSTKQVKNLVRTEGFPSFRVGRNYFVKAELLDEYLAAGADIKIDYNKY